MKTSKSSLVEAGQLFEVDLDYLRTHKQDFYKVASDARSAVGSLARMLDGNATGLLAKVLDAVAYYESVLEAIE